MKHKIKLPSLERLKDVNDLNACEDALEWLLTQPDLITAWNNCNRSDWMIWILRGTRQLPSYLDLQIQLIVLETPLGDGRKVIDLITDERSLAFIDMKRRRLSGEFISAVAWDAARDAASAAVRDARDARDAAWDAAWDARDAASKFQANELRKMIEIVD
jgi:hypothetical protein